MPASARLARNPRRLVARLAIAGAFVALVVASASRLAIEGGGGWFFLVTVGFAGAAFAGVSAYADGLEATCPACGAVVGGVTKGAPGPVPCASCDRFLYNDGDALSVLEERTVLDQPSFAADLPTLARWPDACCVCFEPPVRRMPVELRTLGRGGASTGRVEEVPVCADHVPGVILTRLATDQAKFRSLRYWRAFRDANTGLEP